MTGRAESDLDEDDEEIIFAKIDAHLDSNPKVRKGGRDARDVFEFVLRRNALMRRDGSIPLSYLDPDYLADILMMTCDEARHGTSRAVTVGLLEIDTTAEVVRVVGWTHEWGRRAKEGKERTKKWRESKKAKSLQAVTGGDDARRSVTLGDAGDGSEGEGEGDQRESRSPDSHTHTRAPEPAGSGYDPGSLGDRGKLTQRVYSQLSDARLLVARELGLPPPNPFPPITPATRPAGYRDLLERVSEEGINAPRVCEAILQSLLDQARAERSIDWLSEKVFKPGAWRTAREDSPGSRRRAGPKSSPAVGRVEPKRPEEYPDGEVAI